MTLRLARTALYAIIPAEVLLVLLLVADVPLPAPLVAGAEVIVMAVLLLELTAATRLYLAARRDGLGRRESARAVYEELVPRQVRRLMGFDLRGLASLVLWLARRRDVPPGAVPVGYSKGQTTTMLMFLFAMVVELVGLEFLLRALDWPAAVRVAVLVIDLYSVLIVLAVIASCVTRPHLVTPDELRLRYGVFFDLRVPRHLIKSVRTSRNYNETGLVTLADGRLALAVSSQTNVVVELAEPVTVTRPLGRQAPAATLRFFADDPDLAHGALRPRTDRDPVLDPA
ncbi:hypothetical protein [Actinocorallia populi]|uniref:hypothetical protein n=1 Tax=Actinocorallia populi TaxID=2079200 RepID=UPI0018E5659B|nr:hypothetical protein [Actinocorallia populi]